jgi:hypothetical protein
VRITDFFQSIQIFFQHLPFGIIHSRKSLLRLFLPLLPISMLYPGDRGAFPLCLPSLLCDAPLESPDPVPSLTVPNLAGSGLAVISDLGER